MEVDSPVLLVPLPAPDAFILFCVALLVEGFASGGPRPAVAQPKGAYQRCKRYWWTNMLYVNNLVPFKDTFTEQCFGHAWYLGNDMQFFIILPLFIVAYTFNRRAGYASLFVGFWASIIYSLWAAGHFHWSAGVDGPPHQVDYYYLRPWTRIPPYLVGSATALLLNDVSSKPSRIICEAMKLVALLILGLCYFGAYPFWQSPMKHGLKRLNHSYVALTKPAWAVALSLLCWPSFRGHRGMIGRLLELPLWEPLAKLTYAMYLIHMPVLEIFLGPARPSTSRYTWWGFAFLGVASATGLVAVVLYLFVELPFHNLVMLLRKRLADAAGAPRGRRRRPRRARRAAHGAHVAGVGGRGELEIALAPIPLFPPFS